MTNVVLNAGSGGATLATDTVGGVDYQKVKVTFSTDGVAPTSVDATHGLPDNLVQVGGNTVKTSSGVGSTGSLNVYLATDQPSLTNALPVAQSGSWTVAATQSGAPWSVGGNVASGGADSGNPVKVGHVFNTTQPTVTNAQRVDAQATARGALLVATGVDAFTVAGTVTANQGGAPWSQNVTQFGGTNLSTGTGVGGVGIPRVTISNDSSLAANQSVNVNQVGGTATKTNSGVGSAGSLNVYIATDQPSLTNALPVSQSGTWTVQPGNTANTTPWLATNVPGTSPGSTRSRVKAAATTNATSLKGSAGVVLGYAFYNNTASSKCFKFYDKATAPTVGTDVPAFTVIIPASGGANVEFSTGIPFGTGIAYAITGLVADADTTATAVDDVHGCVLWK